MLKFIAQPHVSPAAPMGTARRVIGTALALLMLAAAGSTSGCARAASSTLGPQELLERAWREFRLEDFDLAQRDFDLALAKLNAQKPSTPAEEESNKKLRANATYGLGLVASLGHHGENPARTTRLLQEVIGLSPHSDMAAWAALALAREQYLPVTSDAREDVTKIKANYAQVMADYPGTPAADEAFVYMQALSIQSLAPGQIREAIKAIEGFLAAHPQPRYLASLCTLEARGYRVLNEQGKALEMLIKAAKNKEIDPTNPQQDNAMDYYAIGLAAQYDVGDFATAREYYGKFLKDYPKDQKAFTVQVHLQRMAETEQRIAAELAGKVKSAGGPATTSAGGRP